jgi:hypothetical protein
MNIYSTSIKEALEKDLIIAYLRRIKNRNANILEIRDNVFHPKFSFEKVKQYVEELKNDQLVSVVKSKSSEIGYKPNETFLDLGGHIRVFFELQKIGFNAIELVEAHHKDLILYYLLCKDKQKSTDLTDLEDLRILLLSADNIKLRYYVDKLRTDGYIDSMANDDYIFRYYPSSDRFMDEGGYSGQYLFRILEAIKRQKFFEEEQLSPESLTAKRRLEKRKEYIENMKTGFLYFSLKYGWLFVLGLLGILYSLIKCGVITQEKAIASVTWIIDRIK